MSHSKYTLAALVWLLPGSALGANPPLHVDPSLDDCSVEFAPELTQGSFARFVREFGSVSAFKLVASPRSLGKWGVAVGIEDIFFSVDEHSAAWNDTFAHPNATHDLGASHSFPKLRLRVGITEDLDLGAFYTENPNANYGWIGVEGKYTFLRQSASMPVVVAGRLAYTKTLYIEDMDMHAVTADVVAGRTFWDVLTPYAGVGNDLVLARETAKSVDLHAEAQNAPHALAGFEARIWHVGFGAEATLATIPSVQVQVSAVF